VLRKQQLDVTELFREQGRYTYRNGVNMRAIAALVIAILPVVPGFIRAVSVPGGRVAAPNVLDHLYSYAWFVTFALSFGLYVLFMRGEKATLVPRGAPLPPLSPPSSR
jgi:NCS1 family nucleobase:cation symporter-1